MTSKRNNLFFALLIPAMVLLYILFGGSAGISLDFGEDALMLSAANYDWDIPYGQIQSLELTELPDPGTPVEGTEKRALCCGIWKNEAWGEYILCADPGIEACIVIRMKTGDIYVLNYENSDSTGQLYQMFSDLLRSKTS